MGRLAFGGWIVALAMLWLSACGPSRQEGFDSGPTDTGPNDVVSELPPGDSGTCSSNADCDDHLACTTDQCQFDHTCLHASTCASGMFCTATGCSAMRTCSTNADCDDHIMCTQDICGAGGMCQNLRDDNRCNVTLMETCSVTLGCIGSGRCGVDADCDDGRYCNGTEHCIGAMGTTAGTCHAGQPITCMPMTCMVGMCSEMTHMCMYQPQMPCGGTVTPGAYSLSPAPAYMCMAGSMSVDSTVMLSTPSGGVSVTGFRVNGTAVTLNGAAPSMGMFSVSGSTSSGGCTWSITLSGSFSGSTTNQFMGNWVVSLDSCFAGSGDCFGGAGPVTGTLH